MYKRYCMLKSFTMFETNSPPDCLRYTKNALLARWMSSAKYEGPSLGRLCCVEDTVLVFTDALSA